MKFLHIHNIQTFPTSTETNINMSHYEIVTITWTHIEKAQTNNTGCMTLVLFPGECRVARQGDRLPVLQWKFRSILRHFGILQNDLEYFC